MSNFREKIARILAPEMKSGEELRSIVAEEISRAKMAMPITANYDPKNEGYRPSSGSILNRNLWPISQTRMLEIAYYMWDASPMLRRMATMDKGFLFAEKISIDSKDDDVKAILQQFWKKNKMDLTFPNRIMWLGILGEQIWPVDINPFNGFVKLLYEDPILVNEVYISNLDMTQAVQIEMMGLGGRVGRKMAVIREDEGGRSKSYGKLVGDCFFYTVNKPPNGARGRSDFLTLFDWIDGVERYGFNFLERAEFMLNFVWDVTLKGMNEDQIRDWLRDNPPPEPGSLRAHNENVTWQAVAPDIKAGDFTGGFDMGKSFIMGAAGRPDSWFGGGGKAYQTEAEQFGQVPIKDLKERQMFAQYILEDLLQFQIDQAVLAGRLSEEKSAAGFTVNFPEISTKDLAKMVNGVPQLTTALAVAVTSGWLSKETATKFFAFICGYFGFEVDAQAEIDAALKARETKGYEDYK